MFGDDDDSFIASMVPLIPQAFILSRANAFCANSKHYLDHC